jgi:glutaconyl-CoA/methylmalonyl-CoA decarboxylase subunit gamma
MIIKVKMDEQVYEVEIGDLRIRPIIAVVEGEEFEVWPEGEPTVHARRQEVAGNNLKPPLIAEALAQPAIQSTQTPSANAFITSQSQQGNDSLLVVRAPIPGVITAVSTQAGAEVAVGQQLCVLEAMKMNNSIRASRAGCIAAVHVSVGQHVKHHDILLEYAE